MQQFAVNLRRAKRYALIALIVALIVAALVTAFLTVRGIITTDLSGDISITYGETPRVDAKALFTDVHLEYSTDGGSTWSEKMPTKAGEYLVRAAADSSTFKLKNTGKAFAFVLAPKAINVSIAEGSVCYGDEPTLKAALCSGDRFSSYELSYRATDSEDTVYVTPEQSSIRIENADGDNVTGSYLMTVSESKLNYTPRPITVDIKSAEKEYDGTPLTSDKFTQSGKSLREGDTISIDINASITDVGSVANDAIIVIKDSSGRDVGDKYSITKNAGTLTVRPRQIKLKSESAEKVYDGTALTASVKTDGDLANGQSLRISDVSSITSVGSIQNDASVIIVDASGNDKTYNYSITRDLGTLTVKPRAITVKAEGGDFEYDGTPHTSTPEITEGSLAQGQQITLGSPVTLTDVGSVTADATVRITDPHAGDVTSNYDIKKEFGTITVKPRPITVTAKGGEKIYDGTPITSTPSLTGGSIAQGQTLTLGAPASQTDVGSVTADDSVVIRDRGGRDVTHNYEITRDFKPITVKPRPITVTAKGGEKIYDGTSITSTPAITAGSLAPNQTATLGAPVSLTDVGSVTADDSVVIRDRSGRDVTHNYEITRDFKPITVKPRPITVSAAGGEWIYDGTAHVSTPAITAGSLAPNQTIKLGAPVSLTDVGTVTASSSVVIRDASGRDVTYNYEITRDFKPIVIKPRPITVSTTGGTKEYDGQPLYGSEGKITSGSLAKDQRIELGSPKSLTDAGDIVNSVSIAIYDKNDRDVTHNYEITRDFGKLTITPRKLTFSSISGDKTYDGELFIYESYSLMSGSLVSGHTRRAVFYGAGPDAGEYENVFEIFISAPGIGDVTHNYDITYNNGKLLIRKRDLTLLTGSVTATYNGTIYQGTRDYTIVGGSFAPGQRLSVLESTMERYAGTYDNIFTSYEILAADGITPVSKDNYNLTFRYGKIVINKRVIVITSDSAEKVYDGTPLIADSYTMLDGTTLGVGDRVEGPYRSDAIDVGTYVNVFVFMIVDTTGTDVTDSCYIITSKEGTLNITKRKITFVTGSLENYYNGKEQYYHEVDYDPSSLKVASGHSLNVTNSSSTIFGKIDNVFNEYHIYSELEQKDVTYNYDINIVGNGTINITRRPITITSASDSKEYDGTPLTNHNYEIGGEGLAEGDAETVTVSGTQIEIGVSKNYFSYAIRNADGADVRRYYLVTREYGDLEVYARKITILSGSDEKVYDGTPLTNSTYELTVGELIEGHTLDIVYTGSITEPGFADNTYTYIIRDAQGNDVTTTHYAVTQEYGTLAVHRIKLTVTTASASKLYDGTPLTNPNYKYEGDVLPEHRVRIVVTGTITDYGKTENTFNIYINNRADGSTAFKYYEIIPDMGMLEIYGNGTDSILGDVNKGTGDNLGNTDSGDDSKIILQVKSMMSDSVYLRYGSYGNYTGSGWTAAPPQPYSYPDVTVSPLAIPGIALAEKGYMSGELEIKCQLGYLTPYFGTVDAYGGILDDRWTTVNSSDYIVSYYDYDSKPWNNEFTLPEEFAAEEQKYREFVYANYLDVPADTRKALLQIAAEKDLIASNSTVIDDVARYIRGAARYDKEAIFPSGVKDTVIYFLTEGKAGVCRHFASAATLMYRSLGIPARYVTGFATTTVAGEWVALTEADYHAWVEVYIDGFGWYPVEVTGSADGSDFEPEVATAVIGFMAYKTTYDGKPLAYDTGSQSFWFIESGSLPEGYSLRLECDVSRTEAGETIMGMDDFTFILTDKYGNEYSAKGSTDDMALIKFMDASGNPVNVYLERSNIFIGRLTVSQRSILILTEDIEKVYDGKVLRPTELDGQHWWLSEKLPLADNHEIVAEELVFDGYQQEVGSSDNSIDESSIIIRDVLTGEIVTHNYDISYSFGKLTVR